MQPDWIFLITLALGGLSVLWLLPHEQKQPRLFAGLVGAASLALFLTSFVPPLGDHLRDGLVWLFGGVAIVGGVLMITDRNPVFAALWFAIVTLATCGLFMLNSAPFLAAATVVIYAGAIVVTFVFVIMLAQQNGIATYDVHAQQRRLAPVIATVLLGALLYPIKEWHAAAETSNAQLKSATARVEEAPVQGLTSLRALGRFLFSDQLYSVELAGTVILVATVGAIAIAPRRTQGHL